jgi:signal transduction histidine kinase
LRTLKTQRTALLVLLTGALLVVLAVLQYRWVGDLSEFELEQAQRTLGASTGGFARELGGEFRRIRSTFRVRRGRNLDQEIFDEYSEWLDRSDYPDLIVDAYWLDFAPADSEGSGPAARQLRLRQAGLQSVGLDSADWSSALEPIRQRILADNQVGQRGRARQAREWLERFSAGQFAYVVPQDERGPSGWAVVILDRQVLVDQVVPNLVEEYFGAEGERDYLVRILSGDASNAGELGNQGDAGNIELLYASDPDALSDRLELPDIRRNISDEGAEWIVEATHQAGSLETYVSQHRWRNLSLGFGAVLVLGVSFSFLLVAARRAHWLAERQMEFVAGVSHELRTPIAGISSLSQNLADGVVRDLDHAARYGATINTESHRLNDMVEKVLHFSAIRSGQYHYKLEPIDIRTVVEPEIEVIERSLDKGVRVESTFADELPQVLGDTEALRSVVRNLISNAVKFGKKGTEVGVSVRQIEGRKGAEIELVVDDRGDGIPDLDLSHIFEPFYRGSAARERQVRGSGLGLSLVREIVTAHHGRVEVDTHEGEGSRFSVYLPAVQEGVSRGTAG